MNFKNFKDYYDILEVDFKSTTKEIKDSYKRLALKFHPDKNKNPESEYCFKKIKEAYEVLNDHEKREAYNILYKKVINYRVKMSREDHETNEYGISKEMTETGLLIAGGAIAGAAMFYGLKLLFSGNNPNENNEDDSDDTDHKYTRKKNKTYN